MDEHWARRPRTHILCHCDWAVDVCINHQYDIKDCSAVLAVSVANSVWANAHQATSHMNKVDQSVRATDAKAYVHSMMTEHSLSPAPNSCVIVPMFMAGGSAYCNRRTNWYKGSGFTRPSWTAPLTMAMPNRGRNIYRTTMIPIRSEARIPEPFKPLRRFPPMIRVRAGMAASPSIEVESCRTRRGAVLPISNFRSWGTIPMINPRIYTRKHSSILGLRSLCRTVLHKHQTSNIITQMIFFSCDRAHVFKMNRSFHLHFSRSYTSHNAMGPLLMHVEEAKPDASVTGQNDLYSRRIIQSTTSTYIYVAQNGPQIKEISWWTHRKIYP